MVDAPFDAYLDTPNKSIRQNVPRKGVCLHHAAMTNLSELERLAMGAKQVSATAIVKDRISKRLMTDEFRAWSLSSAWGDSSFRSCETCNDRIEGYTLSDASHWELAYLVAYWAILDGFWPHRDGDPKTWTVVGHREMYTIWGVSYATACPGGMDLDLVTRRAQDILRGITEEKTKELGDITMRYIWAENRGGLLLTEDKGPRIPVDVETAQVQSKLYAGVDVGTREWDVARQDCLTRLDPNTEDAALIKAIADEFDKRLQDAVDDPTLPDDPAQIELLGYEVARQVIAGFGEKLTK